MMSLPVAVPGSGCEKVTGPTGLQGALPHLQAAVIKGVTGSGCWSEPVCLFSNKIEKKKKKPKQLENAGEKKKTATKRSKISKLFLLSHSQKKNQ